MNINCFGNKFKSYKTCSSIFENRILQVNEWGTLAVIIQDAVDISHHVLGENRKHSLIWPTNLLI